MSCYLVATRIRTHDAAELETYRRMASKAVTADQTIHVVYGGQEILEGAPHEGMVIIEFPDAAAAKRWYYSDAYRAAREHRLRGGDYQMTLVQGFAPDHVSGAPLR